MRVRIPPEVGGVAEVGVVIPAKGSAGPAQGGRGRKGGENTREYGFRHGVVASTWAFEAQGPGSIPGGGATIRKLRIELLRD